MHGLFTLRLLGSTDLQGASESEARLILVHPKRIALLAYLLLARPHGYHRRDSLIALLWPESDAEHARSSLRQAVHQIRRVVGHAVILGRGDEELAVNPEVLGCDALEFETLLAAGRQKEALELYRGDLLPGFFAADASGFEEWLERERARLKGLAAREAWEAAARLAEQGDSEAAAQRAQWAAALEPFEEAAQQRLIRTLVGLDRPAEALRAYDAYRVRLRREFDSEPAPETTASADEARRRIAAVAGSPSPVHPPPEGFRPGALAATAASESGTPWIRRRAAALLFMSGALAVLVLAAARARFASRSQDLDAQAIVVAPFRLATTDTTLAFLEEGLVDLISAGLDGSTGLRAVNPRAVLAASRRAGFWREPIAADARRMAAQLRAGRLLVGALVGRPERLVLTATVHDVSDGKAGQAVSVEGPLDSLPELVDRLVAGVLATEARQSGTRDLTSASLPALRQYLLGRAAYRRGRYEEAAELLRDAVRLDSSSATMWLELAMAADWLADGNAATPREQAWRLRDRLPARDRVLLEAILGPRFPRLTGLKEWLAAWERAARLMPDRPEVQFELGDRLFHYGLVVGRDSGMVRAREAFNRAVALDSSYAAPLLHLAQLAILHGDVRNARRLAGLYLARDSAGDDADFLRWRLALALGDSAEVRRVERRFSSMSDRSLVLIVSWAQFEGVRVGMGLEAARELAQRSRGVTPGLGSRILSLVYGNLGKFREREQLLRSWGFSEDQVNWATISDAAWWQGDRTRALALLEARLASRRRAAAPSERAHLAFLTGGEGDPLEDSAQRLMNPGTYHVYNAYANARRAPASALDHLASLDSLRLAEPAGSYLFNWAAASGAMVLEQMGDARRALSVVRARAQIDEPGLAYLSSTLNLEGRLALATGDTAAARRAWRHYLALRYDPDPESRPQADSVRDALARLDRTRQR